MCRRESTPCPETAPRLVPARHSLFHWRFECGPSSQYTSLRLKSSARNPTGCLPLRIASRHDAGGPDSEIFRHSYEVSDGIRFHLREHLMAMHLDGPLGDSQVEA